MTVTPLGPVAPVNLPGQALYLVHYTIARALELPLHHHEGTQIGLVTAGELTYRVVSGEVPVFRTEPGGKSEQVRTVRAGETAIIGAGEWVVEEPERPSSGCQPGHRAGFDHDLRTAPPRRSAGDQGLGSMG